MKQNLTFSNISFHTYCITTATIETHPKI